MVVSFCLVLDLWDESWGLWCLALAWGMCNSLALGLLIHFDLGPNLSSAKPVPCLCPLG